MTKVNLSQLAKDIKSPVIVYRHQDTGKYAFAIRYKNNIEDIQKFIEFFGSFNVFQKIEKSISRKEALEKAQRLIDTGTLSYRVDSNGIPFDELPEDVKHEISRTFNGSKWSKWTAEDWIATNGWYPNDRHWFSISEDRDYVYQLILQEDDWVTYCTYGTTDGHFFGRCVDIKEAAPLPDCYSWDKVAIW